MGPRKPLKYDDLVSKTTAFSFVGFDPSKGATFQQIASHVKRKIAENLFEDFQPKLRNMTRVTFQKLLLQVNKVLRYGFNLGFLKKQGNKYYINWKNAKPIMGNKMSIRREAVPVVRKRKVEKKQRVKLNKKGARLRRCPTRSIASTYSSEH